MLESIEPKHVFGVVILAAIAELATALALSDIIVAVAACGSVAALVAILWKVSRSPPAQAPVPAQAPAPAPAPPQAQAPAQALPVRIPQTAFMLAPMEATGPDGHGAALAAIEERLARARYAEQRALEVHAQTLRALRSRGVEFPARPPSEEP